LQNADKFFSGGSVETNDATKGGEFIGKTHKDGGMPAIIVNAGNQPIEVETKEIIINAKSSQCPIDECSHEFDGKEMSNKEILSRINVEGGGVPIMENGGELNLNDTDGEIKKSIILLSAGVFVEDGHLSESDVFNKFKELSKSINHIVVYERDSMDAFRQWSKRVVLAKFGSMFDENSPVVSYRVGNSNIVETAFGTLVDGRNVIFDLKEVNWFLQSDEFGGGGDVHDRGNRPSPKESATLYPEGYEMIGQDGNMYHIAIDSRGVHRWQKGRSEKVLTRSKFIDNLHPLDLWVQFSDGRWYRKFEIPTTDPKWRSIADFGIKERVTDDELVISVRNDSEAQSVSELFMQEFPVEGTVISSETKKQNNMDTVEKQVETKAISLQDRMNQEVRQILAEKGLVRSLYTESDLRKLFQYTGGTKTQDEITDGYFWDFYTPDEVVRICWRLAYKYGFLAYENTTILEPSCSVGRFLRYAPDFCKVTGYDIDQTSYMIAKLLFPQFNIVNDTFEKYFYIPSGLKSFDLKASWNKFNLVIGNPPYKFPYETLFSKMEKRIYPFINNLEQWFIMRGVDALEKDGLLIYVVPSTIVDNENSKQEFKDALFAKANMLDLYRLPAKTFQDTDVTTDIIVLQKK
jgi:hypothetical protein